MAAGYRVYYYDGINHYERCEVGIDNPKILHDSVTAGQKLSFGRITQALNTIWLFEFSININNQYYSDINQIVGLVKIVNLFDNEIEFFGRVLKLTGKMSSDGEFSKSYICESVLGYLHDSAQVFSKTVGDIPRYLGSVLEEHNQQVEAHKRFYIRTVTVVNDSDIPNRYTAYDDTFDTIKNYLVERQGGYIKLDIKDNRFYIDYLKSIGEYVNTPIKLGKNLKSAEQEIDLDGLITRLVPVGADLDDAEERDTETGQYITHKRVTIEDVNDGLRYLDDIELIEQYGIIQKTVDWTEISDKNILKKRGQQYLDEQKIALASWRIEVVELSLIDSHFSKFKIGNTHPIENAPLSGIEKLQITEKEIDILNPQTVSLTIGDKKQSLTAFQLQQKEARESMERVMTNNNAAQKAIEAQILSAQEDLTKEQEALSQKISNVSSATSVSMLQTTLSQYQTLQKTEQSNLTSLRTELAKIDTSDSNNDNIVSLINTQIALSQTRIDNYALLIQEINDKISELGGT